MCVRRRLKQKGQTICYSKRVWNKALRNFEEQRLDVLKVIARHCGLLSTIDREKWQTF